MSRIALFELNTVRGEKARPVEECDGEIVIAEQSFSAWLEFRVELVEVAHPESILCWPPHDLVADLETAEVRLRAWIDWCTLKVMCEEKLFNS